jgi:hypothetical protein
MLERGRTSKIHGMSLIGCSELQDFKLCDAILVHAKRSNGFTWQIGLGRYALTESG